MRESGILLHVSSLPSKYGIGTFGKEAYKFIDFLEKTNLTYWQILPLGPTSYGDSPYQSFSANALNPYFVDLDILVSEGLINTEDLVDAKYDVMVDYNKLYEERYLILKKAFKRFNLNDKTYIDFINKEAWLHDYALYMTIKKHYDDVSLIEWPVEAKIRDKKVLDKFNKENLEDVNFYKFIQFKAYEQYFKMKEYANNKGIKIVGDIPIYVAYDSSDVWTRPELFQLDEESSPVFVAGVPPDPFTADGQLWGNPLYDWEKHEEEGFKWWINRIKSQTEMFDMIRIDHFIGFENYYSIPFEDSHARNGVWKKAPGKKLFEKVREELGELNIIAEDLGVITDEVKALLKYTKFPGMKLLQFAFDPREESDYIPHLYDENCVAYTGTHDNETSRQWFEGLSKENLEYCLDYINCQVPGTEVDSLIKATLASKARLAIIPMQDYLNLGKEARMNIPSTLGGNWQWRLNEQYETEELVKKIKKFVKLYGRNRK